LFFRFFGVPSGDSVFKVPARFMALVKPFCALRPKPELAARVCELPYDVMSSAEARQVADGNELSFLHVSKPEIDLPVETDPYAPEVYRKGRENLEQLISKGALQQDPTPGFYLYRQVMGTHSQTGLVAVTSCQEYLDGIIKKHEFTRPEKEDDRVRHIESLDAQTGPVFLTCRISEGLREIFSSGTSGTPSVDFVAADGVRHTAWLIEPSETLERIESEFRQIPFLYIADGHHRSAAAARVFQTRGGAGGSGWFLSVIFPHDQMQILAYNRALRDLNGLDPAGLLDRLSGVFEIKKEGDGRTGRKHRLGLYLDGAWYSLEIRSEHAACADPKEQLDVSLLQKHVLGPVFGIDDPRTSQRISFVGGIRGTRELERIVDSEEYACAFSMYPTGIDDLMAIADADGIMPPKSTWFEPKLRDGMFTHRL
jgi:uncharacterized protein (DUF1015 family)